MPLGNAPGADEGETGLFHGIVLLHLAGRPANETVVDRARLNSHSVSGKTGLKTVASGLPDYRKAVRLGQRVSDGSGHRLRFAGFGEERVIFAQRFLGPANSRRNHRNPKRHGLQNHKRQAFEAGRENQEVGDRHDVGDVRPLPEEVDMVSNIQRGRQYPQRLLLVARADQ
ncbi:hypothetical protein D3C71_615210 [compost metagenome]